jgi:hypothetical protein
MIRTVLTACFALLASISNAKAAIALDPTSKWNVNYSNESCQLARQFGAGDDETLMILEKFGPGEGFSLRVSGETVKRFKREDVIRYRFAPVFRWSRLDYFSGTTGQKRPAIMSRSLSFASDRNETTKAELEGGPIARRISPEELAAVKQLEIRGNDFILKTGPMRAAIASLDTCVRDLVKSWGFDPAVMETLRRRPIPAKGSRPEYWLMSSDFPGRSRSQGRRAFVSVLLYLDAAGKVTKCRVQRDGELDEFDDVVCKALSERARYQPAIDAMGKPVVAFVVQRVVFTY